MAERATTEGPGFPSLLRGIFGDVRALVRQEVRLATADLLKELAKAKKAAAELTAGAVVLGVGALLLCLAGVSALHEAARLPWWAAFLIVGAPFTLVGGALLYAGRRDAAEVRVVPPQAARVLGRGDEKAEPPGAQEPPPAAKAEGDPAGAKWSLLGVALVAGVALEGFLSRRATRTGPEPAPDAAAAAGPGFVDKLTEQLGDEFGKLQDQAIAAVVALVRDVAEKGIAALADVVQAKAADAAARLAAAPPPQAEGGKVDAGGPPAPQPPAP